MITETFGLPGSGKTRYSNKSKLNLIQVNFIEKIFYFLIFFLRRPILSSYLLKEIITKTDTFEEANYFRIIINKILGNYMLTLSKYQKAKFKKNKDNLIDEGFFQLLFATYDKNSNNIEKSVKKISKLIDSVIIFEISEEKRNIKMKKRKEFPREYLGEKYYSKWSKNNKTVFTNIYKLLKKRNIKFNIIKND